MVSRFKGYTTILNKMIKKAVQENLGEIVHKTNIVFGAIITFLNIYDVTDFLKRQIKVVGLLFKSKRF